MARGTTVYTAAAIAVMASLAARGRSSAEIAKAIGSTSASVRVRCSQLQIKLTPGRPYRRRLRLERVPRLLLLIDPATFAGLQRKARSMRRSVHDLAEALLAAIVKANIFDAVLDED